MEKMNEKLRELRRQVDRKKHLEASLRELYAQLEPLEEKVEELQAVKLSEQADVDRLEGRSLAAFFYGVIGKMDEKLDAERREAYAAAVKFDAAARELADVKESIERCEAELRSLLGCEEEFEGLLKEKAAAMRAAGGAAAQEILELEKRIAFLDSQKKELLEATNAGYAALDAAKEVQASLGSAESWGTFDLFGGGLLADIAKHGHLDDAQAGVERLQVRLRRFKTELADVRIQADVQISIDGFLRFADFFFDGLFADWAVMDKINRAQGQVDQAVSQIRYVISKLESLSKAVEKEQAQLRERLNTLVAEH